MKLTSIELHPENSSDRAIFSFRDPTAKNPYNIKGATGLDADEIVPRYYGFLAGGSKRFYNLTLQKREVVFKVGLNPNFSEFKTYSDLRSDLYKMVASSRTGKIQIQFKNDTDIVAEVSGFISKFESPLFEKAQEIQITIQCDEPLLKSPNLVVVESLPSTRALIEDSKSTAPHGFGSKVTITAPLADLSISDPDDPTWAFTIYPAGGFLSGDILYFNSDPTEKSVFIDRSGTIIQLGDVLLMGSMWPIIFPGNNSFSFTHPESVVWNSVGYLPTYWGV